MLYTIISQEDIFYNPQIPEYCEKKLQSGIMTGIVENGKYKPHSFFSTNPSDYLNKDINPLITH